MKEGNGSISATSVERGGGPFDVPFSFRIKALIVQKFGSIRRNSGASSLVKGSVNSNCFTESKD